MGDDRTKLAVEVGELRARVARLEERLSAWEEADELASARFPSRVPSTMHDLEDWVVAWFGDTVELRHESSVRWCAQWYKHPEAVVRLWTLYHSYLEVEALDDAVAYARWLVDVFDPLLDALTRRNGPFANCTAERHSPHGGLRVERNRDADRDWGPRRATVDLRATLWQPQGQAATEAP